MASQQMISNYLEGNAKFASNFSAPPTMDQFRAMLKKGGMKGPVVITCADPRVVPERFMGLENHPTAVIRNAGGRVMDAMRSIQVLNAINPLGLIIVVHHTDCGTTHVSDAEVREVIKNSGSSVSASTLEGMQFGEISSIEESIKEDVKMLREDPLFGEQKPAIVGMLYETETGKLTEVSVD